MYEDYTTFENLDARVKILEKTIEKHYDYMRWGAMVLGITIVLAIV